MKVYTILWVAIGWSLVATAYFIVVPVYASRRVMISISAASTTSETVGAKRLLQIDPRAAVVLALPLLLSASPIVVRRCRARRAITFVAATLLSGLCVLGAMTIGLLFLPSALALWAAAILDGPAAHAA